MTNVLQVRTPPASLHPSQTALPAPPAPPVPLSCHAQPPGRIRIEPWTDPVVDDVGHDPRSSYVEVFWLPVLGPSTTWLLRRFASHLDDAPAGVELSVDDLARRLGIGERSGPNGPFSRTVKRCVDFQMAQWRSGTLAVRRRLPPLARRHIRRLPSSLQLEHESLVDAASELVKVDDRLRAHGKRLALSLMEYGDDQASCESQLVRWGFHLQTASECAAFAGLEHARREAARDAQRAATPGRMRLMLAGAGPEPQSSRRQ